MNQLQLDELKKFFNNISHGEQSNSYIVPAKDLFAFTQYLRDTVDLTFDYLKSITAVDYNENVEVVYELYSLKLNISITLKVALSPGDLKCDSVSSIWAAADWYKREVYDMFGVQFNGHPNMKRILLEDGWVGYPLRKNYQNKDMVKKPV